MPTPSETFAGLAAKLMAKYGAAATLTRVTSTYDADLDTVANTTVTSTILVVLDKSEMEDANGRKSIETSIRSNSALKVSDRVALAGKTYKVETVEETAPTGTAIFYVAKVIAS